jgi:hypothetical protein
LGTAGLNELMSTSSSGSRSVIIIIIIIIVIPSSPLTEAIVGHGGLEGADEHLEEWIRGEGALGRVALAERAAREVALAQLPHQHFLSMRVIQISMLGTDMYMRDIDQYVRDMQAWHQHGRDSLVVDSVPMKSSSHEGFEPEKDHHRRRRHHHHCRHHHRHPVHDSLRLTRREHSRQMKWLQGEMAAQ